MRIFKNISNWETHLPLHILIRLYSSTICLLFILNPLAQPTSLVLAQQSPNTTALTCNAATISELNNCINAAKQDEINVISISAVIICTLTNPCEADLSNINRPNNSPLLIEGSSPNAGFNRQASPTYPMLEIDNSSNIQISNLSLSDSSTIMMQDGCNWKFLSASCNPAISIKYSTNILLDRLTISNSEVAIALTQNTGLTIQNSQFNNIFEFAIWTSTSSTNLNTKLSIVNNTFTNTRSNALFIAGSYVSVLGNTFTHNHHEALFICANDNPCPGGQIYFFSVSNLNIEGNVITDGYIDSYRSGTQDVPYTGGLGINTRGIEFSSNLTNVIIKANTIDNNTGPGIFFNSNLTGLSNFTITNNKEYQDGTFWPNDPNPNDLNNDYIYTFNNTITNSTTTDTCFTNTCTIPPYGVITAFPDPCILNTNNSCTSLITWRSVNSSNTRLTIGTNQKLVSTNISGSVNANWINSSGNTFNLLEEGNLSNSLIVKGVPGITQIITPTNTSTIPTSTLGPSPTPNQGQLIILDSNTGKPLQNCTINLVTNGEQETQNLNTCQTNIPQGNTSVKSIAVNGKVIQVNKSISSDKGYSLSVDTLKGSLVKVLGYTYTPYWFLIPGGILSLILLILPLFLKLRKNTVFNSFKRNKEIFT